MTTVTRSVKAGKVRVETHSVFEFDAALTFQEQEALFAWHHVQSGLETTKCLLKALDTDGQPLLVNGKKWTSRGQEKICVETTFGAAHMTRHVYQTNLGGATRAPMDERAGLFRSCTPDLARMLGSKVSEMSATAVARDMAENQRRPVSDTFAQDTANYLSAQAEQVQDRIRWEAAVKASHEEHCHPVALIACSVDGAMLNSRGDGWRQAQAGTISFYDTRGVLVDTLYVGGGPGHSPKEGKAVFFAEMELTLNRAKALYPDLPVVGVSDGACDFKDWLLKHVEAWVLDYHHAAEYTDSCESFDITYRFTL
jgi:hypothetical protein